MSWPRVFRASSRFTATASARGTRAQILPLQCTADRGLRFSSSAKQHDDTFKDVRAMFNLKDRNFIVPGGGQGIGFAITQAICQMGGNVAVMDLRSEPVEAFKSLSSQYGVKTEYFHTDVTKESSLNASFDQAISMLGTLHGLVPAAGIALDKPFVEQTWDEVNKIQQVNVMSFGKAVHCRILTAIRSWVLFSRHSSLLSRCSSRAAREALS